MILGEDGKPPLNELVHHGVKGMHWGSRKSGTESSKPTAAEIHGARARHNNRIVALDEKAHRLSLAKTDTEKRALLKDIHSISKEGLDSGDHIIAGRITTGEKVLANVSIPVVGGHSIKKSGLKQSMLAEQRLKEYNQSKMSDYHHE
jgi:hypothetical protein